MSSIKPQDIVVLIKLASLSREPASMEGVRQLDIAMALGLSQAEIHNALRRATAVGLMAPQPFKGRLDPRLVRRQALREFLIHGLKYVFPARLGELTRGIPTAWGHAPIKAHFMVHGDDMPVWPAVDGTVRGQSVAPLYRTVPAAVTADPKLHEMLALVDCLRVGRARDREFAAQRLTEVLT